jgi:hypothetical protein
MVQDRGLSVSSGKVKRGWRIVGLLLAAFLFIFTAGGGAAATAEVAWTQTSRVDFESGVLSRLDASGSPGAVKLAVTGVTSLYAFRGNNQRSFWRYNTALNTWTALADAPDKVRWGGTLACDGGGYIYAFRGNNTADFWRYSLPDNSWSVMAAAPGAVDEGGALTFNAGYIFALCGGGARGFWRYDPLADSWTVLDGSDGSISRGGAIIGDGGNNIYAFWGRDTGFFRRYDIAAGYWTGLADAPASVGDGAALSYDGSRYIYALRGNSTPDFWRYDIFTNTWSQEDSIPASVAWGGALACAADNYIFALSGAYDQYFWRYDVSSGVWEWRTNAPAPVYDGGSLTRGEVTYYYSGNLTSSTGDAGYYADFGIVSWNAALPSGTVIKFQIAANNDDATWVFRGPDGAEDTYYTSSGTAVWPGHDGSRYFKYKAFFSTADNGLSPDLNAVTVTYSRQIQLPAVTAAGASPVGKTMAILHGAVADDGGEACQYRFQYGLYTGNYTQETEFTGEVVTGDSFSTEITGLVKGAEYYFCVQLRNSAGSVNSTEFSLVTRPDPPGNLIAQTVKATRTDLGWVRGEGAQRTMVRRKTGDYPADRNDGVLVYFDIGAGFSDTGLAPDTTYYYRAWSEVSRGRQWSDDSRDVSVTTLDGAPVVVGGVVYRINKALVLAPWLGASMIFLFVGGLAFRRLKKKKA